MSDNICVLVTCSDSSYVDIIIRDVLKQRFEVNNNYVYEVKSGKDIKGVKDLIDVPPLIGDRWLIAIDGEKLTFNEIVDFFKNITSNAICYIKCEKYSTYKKINGIKVLKERTQNVMFKYYSKLSSNEINELYKYITKDSRYKLKDELLKYVCSAYTYNIDSVCNLFFQIKSGMEFEDKSSIIDAIGVGGNTVEYTVIQLLLMNINTDRGYKNALKKVMGLLKDLSNKYRYDSIYNFINSTVDGLITLKEMFIAGKYRKRYKEFPSRFTDKEVSKLNKLRRYEWAIEDKISMNRLLCLKMCLIKHKDFNAEVALISCINEYLNAVRYNKFIEV